MAIDVERFQMISEGIYPKMLQSSFIAPQIQQFWSSPLQIALALGSFIHYHIPLLSIHSTVFLFNTLGIAAIPGVVIMSIIIPLSFVSSFLTRRWQVAPKKN
jgi:hypothetical protein